MQEPQTSRLGNRPERQLPDRLRAVGPGWHPLLMRLHEELLAREPGYRVDDLKEKLGGVRVQVTGVSGGLSTEVRALVAAAEAQSAVTCEFCGAPGRRRPRGDGAAGWLKTVCDSCHAAWIRHAIMIVNGVVRRREPEGGER
ncbi:hypothetical protein ABZ484_28740 [Streptomyces sp. NPDC006393]|uniref:hypothetical protein n=1 Tax=Streptomyces sp. NPDC006393 TaxID=3156763 RepID=UPI0033DF615E